MAESRPDPIHALFDCAEAFEELGAAKPGDAALLDRAIGSTLTAAPATGAGVASGLSTTTWVLIVTTIVAAVVALAWPSASDDPGMATRSAVAEHPAEPAVDAPPQPEPEPRGEPPTDGPPLAAEPAVAVESAVQPEPQPPRPRRSTPSASELLAQANAARRAERSRRALELYGRLFELHPKSREALTARVSAGRLLLERGRARAALSHFKKYLSASPRGSLAEEAAAGRAMALGRLGRADAERDAWTDLLERHPGSVHSDRARKRLAALSEE